MEATRKIRVDGDNGCVYMFSDSNGDGRLNDEVRAAIDAGCQKINMDGAGTGLVDGANFLAEVGYIH